MPNNIAHFDIHADDVERARQFYQRVFGWRFEAWGPPDFYLIQTGTPTDPGIHGLISKRSKPSPDKDASATSARSRWKTWLRSRPQSPPTAARSCSTSRKSSASEP